MKYLTLLCSLFCLFALPMAHAAEKTPNEKTYVIDKTGIDGDRLIETHIKELGELLDPLMLEDNPKAEFEKMIPKIKKYSTVTKTGFKGNQFYIEFKNGSSNFWDMPN
jgi:hypothetical protein